MTEKFYVLRQELGLLVFIKRGAVLNTKNLLLLEEDEPLRESIRQFLMLDYDVYLTASLEDARSILQRVSMDVALVDLGLPDGSGVEILPEIRKGNQRSAILVLSGQMDLGGVKKALAAGADDYVLKSDLLIQELLIRIPLARDRHSAAETETLNSPQLPQLESELDSEAFENFLETAERRYFEAAFRLTGGSAERLARKIGLGRSTVFKKLSDLGVSRRGWS